MEAKKEVIELNDLTHRQVLRLFLSLELIEEENEWEIFFVENDINGNRLEKADSYQFIKGRFVGIKNSEAKFLYATIEKFRDTGVPVYRLRKEDVSIHT